jgi:hypothetical protein
MSAGRTSAWLPSCIVFASGYATWKPGSPGCKKNAPREPVPGRMIPVTLGQLLPTLPEGGRPSLTATMVRRMTMTIELARFTVDDDAVPALLAGRPAMVRALAGRFPGCPAAYLTRGDDGSRLDIVP